MHKNTGAVITKAKACLLVACGLPGAGKTALCKALLGVEASNVRVVHICFDNYLIADSSSAGGRLDVESGAWKEARRLALSDVQAELAACQEADISLLLLVDDNMYYRSMRYEMAQLARHHNAAYVVVYLSCTLEEALARNLQRPSGAQVPAEVMRRMAERLEPPDASRHAWESCSVTLQAAQLPPSGAGHAEEWAAVCMPILAAWGPPLALPQQERQSIPTKASSSAAHVADLHLRQAVQAAVARVRSPEGKAATAKALNAARKALLARLQKDENGRGGCANDPGAMVLWREFEGLCSSFGGCSD